MVDTCELFTILFATWEIGVVDLTVDAKTKWLHLAKATIDRMLKCLRDEVVEQVKSYVYVGKLILADGSIKDEVKNRYGLIKTLCVVPK